MTRRGLGALALAAILGGCDAPPGMRPVTWTASLPPDSVAGAGDPTRAALTRAAASFGNPAALAGNPAAAARAIVDVEYLAVELTGPRWTGMPLAATQLAAARAEWRAAAGIDPSAPPQAVIDTLDAARRALLAGQAGAAGASLPPPLYTPGGAGTLARLAQLPPLPRTAAAAVLASREATQAQFDGRGTRPIR